MPSLHAADSVIVGVALAILVRHRALRVLFLLWPMWVSFSLIATGNHFWLDIVAGILLAGLGAALTAANHAFSRGLGCMTSFGRNGFLRPASQTSQVAVE